MKISVASIQAAVASHFQIPIESMKDDNRKRAVAWPRQVAMILAYWLTDHSGVRIGQLFNRDHTTIIHARRAISRRLHKHEETRHALRSLTKQLLIDRQALSC